MGYRIITGDVSTVVNELGSEPFDAIFCDPPYGLTFMGKDWDRGIPGPQIWAKFLTHLKPGANVLAFGGTRTYHRLTCAIEDAGFDIRDGIIVWHYGSGWPKPANISKMIDKKLKRQRTVIDQNPNARPNRVGRDNTNSNGAETEGSPITAPASDEAKLFDGYHANLKPAWEPVVMARKPLDETLANNALTHGLAGLNIDGCRIDTTDDLARVNRDNDGMFGIGKGMNAAPQRSFLGLPPLGRWPTNVIYTCHEQICGPGDPREIEHRPGCHVFELDQQNCNTSKFFYVAKVSSRERAGSKHPTMKPVELCTYIARLILPPVRTDGKPRRLLVPFSGSGSEMIGALRAGWDDVVGIEMEPEYVATAESRLQDWETRLATEIQLQHVLDRCGFLKGSDFKPLQPWNVKAKDWIGANYLTHNPNNSRRYVRGKTRVDEKFSAMRLAELSNRLETN